MTEKFACAACGAQHEHDERVSLAECRECRRMHCPDCMTPEGLCKKCSQEK